jgi:hypothetical protein
MLIQDGMKDVDPAAFDGHAKSLLAAIQHLGDTTVQRQAVVAYWHLSAAITRHAFARQASAFLQQVQPPTQPDGQALFEAARATAAARQDETGEEVTASQYDLLERSFAADLTILPWPDDTPLVGSYRTNFETLFGDHPAPLRLRRIHDLLPATKRVIEARARAVVAAREARDVNHVAYHEGRLPIRSLLDACEQLRLEQQALVAAVLRYNEAIAEYALAVVGPAADPATVVSTLIKWQTPPAVTQQPASRIQQASAEEPLPSDAQQPAPAAAPVPNTAFSDGPRVVAPPAMETPPTLETPPGAETPSPVETPPAVETSPAVESRPAREIDHSLDRATGTRSVLRSVRIAHEAEG